MTAIPLALYAHFPWCVQKCPYCDFNSHRAPNQLPEMAYVDALLEDLDLDLQRFYRDRPVPPLTAIFFGGGTPSLFSPAAMDRFLRGVRQRLTLPADIEITMEANPGTIEHGRFADYKAAGINRVSLGVQSFDADQLRLLGRIHGVAEIPLAVAELQRAGITNFNLDLMYGLSGQTLDQALADLQQAIDLQPTHLSHYQLTLEPGTVFYHQPPPLPDDERCYAMQLACQTLLAEHGYAQYEVSAYSRPGFQARHNRNYWEFGDYFGVGAGAHGKHTSLDAGSSSVQRTERLKQPREYLQRSSAERLTLVRAVPTQDLPFEFMLNGLRLTAGVPVSLFQQRTGLPWAQLHAVVADAQRRGLLAVAAEWCRPTELGRQYLNDLMELFLPAT